MANYKQRNQYAILCVIYRIGQKLLVVDCKKHTPGKLAKPLEKLENTQKKKKQQKLHAALEAVSSVSDHGAAKKPSPPGSTPAEHQSS